MTAIIHEQVFLLMEALQSSSQQAIPSNRIGLRSAGSAATVLKETEIENPTRAVPKVEEANNQAIAEGKLQPELTDSVEMEWRSFRSLPRDHPEWLKP
jgi:hypothetical protein